MPIIVHFGNPRQGKSYAAVADHIVPALGRGRRVVTNIEGMGDPDRQAKMAQLVARRTKREEPLDFHFVPHSQLEQATIFPVDTKKEDADGTRIFDDSLSVVKFGTLIVWDEARAFTTGELPKYWHDALTYHGHWARGGSTVDIVLIHQNWKSLAPLVRATAELVYEFVKRTSGKGYTRFTYSSPGDRDVSRKAADTLTEKFSYDPEVFALYKTNADDAVTNDNVALPFWKTHYFKSKIRLIVTLGVIGVVCTALAIWRLVASLGAPAHPGAAVAAPGQAVAGAVQSAPVEPASIVGRLPVPGGTVAIVKDGDRFENVVPVNGTVIYRGRELRWPTDF